MLGALLSIAADRGAERPKAAKRDAVLQHGALGESG